MAQKVVVQLIDDLEGEPIDSGGETISFAVNGVEYSIDLNEKNATEFHRKMDYYIKYATRVGGRKAARPAKRTTNGANTQQIREWANANGYTVSARGRIAADILESYTAAH
ncbi:histone-like nucleoid-structuring protein Lsr2 [Prescottella equi]|uniref:histone-like nucleoid-structuring protein Lsr2 n=1 Tax=Rhodococcus hoagii TaxID=43767 RepID=UPI0023DB0A1C|nr:Lsr2 family protein [Prescottella equi]